MPGADRSRYRGTGYGRLLLCLYAHEESLVRVYLELTGEDGLVAHQTLGPKRRRFLPGRGGPYISRVPISLPNVLLGSITVVLLLNVPLSDGHPYARPTSPAASILGPANSVHSSVAGWVNLTRATGPPLGDGVSLTYDAKDAYTVLFGGTMVNGYQYSNVTWEFQKGLWSNHTGSVAPPARNGAVMTYDAKDGYVVLFGGLGIFGAWPSSHVRDDTWTFMGGRWSNVTPAVVNASNTPPGRWHAAMAYDPPCGCLVLFGGGYYPDTWEYRAGTWTNVTTVRSPPGRLDPAMAFDGKDRYLVLFGGEGPRGTAMNDTWRWSHGSWKNITVSRAPSARVSAAFAFDGKTGTLVLFGGSLLGSSSVLGDTWNFTGGVWTSLSPTVSPPPRGFAGFAYDPPGGYLLLYGGVTTGFNDLHDTWRYR